MDELTANKKNLTGSKARCLRLNIEGAVQGVGFRPFVYRLASDLGVNGWVSNSSQGVEIEIEGNSNVIQHFLDRLQSERPPLAFIDNLAISDSKAKGFDGFIIKESDSAGQRNALVLPDIATCPECLKEIFDPANRRYFYPFTNCTNCGPRYSIIESLPYDRPNTTMKIFEMCDECRAEYENPKDRRFHAQPNACPRCGPHLELLDSKRIIIGTHHDALLGAAKAIINGEIVALKGIGGFQLLVDARNDESVERLRHRKGRDEKPFALMYPDLQSLAADCKISHLEHELLKSYASPIVILNRTCESHSRIAGEVAPGNPNLGAMLPYTPLHHVLMNVLNFPIVATSGNLSDEPICIDNDEAIERLHNVADKFLVHNRPIARHVDDSVVRAVAGQTTILRRARGYAPLPVNFTDLKRKVLAVGAHLKNTAAISVGSKIFVTQHIGDLDNEQAYSAFTSSIKSLSNVYEFAPGLIISDKHPDYMSSKYAAGQGATQVEIQHHVAHIYSCMAENNIQQPVLGAAWDGTGLGDDNNIWGGEFFSITESGYKRVAHFRTFALPGGDQSIKEPRRTALGLLYELDGLQTLQSTGLDNLFSENEIGVIRQMLAKKINAPLTSSAGRLFDAVSSLLGIRHFNNYEGQAAMELEFATGNSKTDDSYPFDLHGSEPIVIDWEMIIKSIISDIKDAKPVSMISACFHNTLAEIIVKIAGKIGIRQVALSGGCFQNKYLTEKAIDKLRAKGFNVFWHHVVPPNDGGISLGQIAAAYYNNKWEAK